MDYSTQQGQRRRSVHTHSTTFPLSLFSLAIEREYYKDMYANGAALVRSFRLLIIDSPVQIYSSPILRGALNNREAMKIHRE